MAFMDFLFGKKGGFEQTPSMIPQQRQLLEQLLGGLGETTGQGFDFLSKILGGDTSQFEAPLMRQFYEQTVPGIAERFSGMGVGAQGSSAFGQQMGAAGAGLAEQLGALRGQLGLQGLSHLQGLMGQGLGSRAFESIYRPSTSGFIGGTASGIGTGIGMGLTGGFGGFNEKWRKWVKRSGGSGLRSGEIYNPQYGYRSGG
jgi:hypothetical protein